MTAALGDSGKSGRTSADGPTLDLGAYRWIRSWLVGIVFFSAIPVFFYLWVSSAVETLGPVTPAFLLAFAMPLAMFVAIPVGLGVAVALRVGTWSLGVSESGIRVTRGRHRPREIPWARITKIRWGPVAVRVSRYRTELAEGIWIDVRGRRTQRFDTARFRVRAADVDAMAAAIRDAAQRHAVAVEPFPMMGRDRF